MSNEDSGEESNDLLDGLEPILAEARKCARECPCDDSVHDYFVRQVEGFFYANVISNYRANYSAWVEEAGPVASAAQHSVLVLCDAVLSESEIFGGTGAICADDYGRFKAAVEERDARAFGLLREVERVLRFRECEKRLTMFRGEIHGLGLSLEPRIRSTPAGIEISIFGDDEEEDAGREELLEESDADEGSGRLLFERLVFGSTPMQPASGNVPRPDYYQTDLRTLSSDQKAEYAAAFEGPPNTETIRKYTFVRLESLLRSAAICETQDDLYDLVAGCRMLLDAQKPKGSGVSYGTRVLTLLEGLAACDVASWRAVQTGWQSMMGMKRLGGMGSESSMKYTLRPAGDQTWILPDRLDMLAGGLSEDR